MVREAALGNVDGCVMDGGVLDRRGCAKFKVGMSMEAA